MDCVCCLLFPFFMHQYMQAQYKEHLHVSQHFFTPSYACTMISCFSASFTT